MLFLAPNQQCWSRLVTSSNLLGECLLCGKNSETVWLCWLVVFRHMAQLMPLTLTVTCFSKIQIGFTFLVVAHLGSPGKRAVKWVCVCWAACFAFSYLDYYGCTSVRGWMGVELYMFIHLICVSCLHTIRNWKIVDMVNKDVERCKLFILEKNLYLCNNERGRLNSENILKSASRCGYGRISHQVRPCWLYWVTLIGWPRQACLVAYRVLEFVT